MITVGRTKISDIRLLHTSITKAYAGKSLVWQKDSSGPVNIYDSTVADFMGYLRYANKIIGVSTDNSNRIVVCSIEPGCTYKVTLLMDTRFRVFTYSGDLYANLTISNYIIDPLDNNGSTTINQVRTLTLKAGANDTKLYVGYWSSTGSLKVEDVKSSIVINKVEG